MKVKTSELIGPTLDYAVAKCEGHQVALSTGTKLVIIKRNDVVDYFHPSTNWGWGGPISEREGVESWLYRRTGTWVAQLPIGGAQSDTRAIGYGPTELIAKMRCIVLDKFGDEVEVPDEFCKDRL